MRQPTERARPAGAEPASWSVYLLRCADGTLYCGATTDVEKRLAAHGRGRVKYTRGRLPVQLAHVERPFTKGAALSREAACKRLTRAQKLALIACAATTNSLHAPDDNPKPELEPSRDARRVRRQRQSRRA